MMHTKQKQLITFLKNVSVWQSLQLNLHVIAVDYISDQKRIKSVLPEVYSVQNSQIHEWYFGLFPLSLSWCPL